MQGFFRGGRNSFGGIAESAGRCNGGGLLCVYNVFQKSYFAGEEEYRFIFPPLHYEKGQDRPQFRLLDQIFLPYIMVELETEQQELPLQSVMVGAKNNSDIAVRGMKYFLKTQGLDIPVLLSDIPLRY